MGHKTFSEIRDDEVFLGPICGEMLDEETGEVISFAFSPEEFKKAIRELGK